MKHFSYSQNRGAGFVTNPELYRYNITAGLENGLTGWGHDPLILPITFILRPVQEFRHNYHGSWTEMVIAASEIGRDFTQSHPYEALCPLESYPTIEWNMQLGGELIYNSVNLSGSDLNYYDSSQV